MIQHLGDYSIEGSMIARLKSTPSNQKQTKSITKNRIEAFKRGEKVPPFFFDTWEEGEWVKNCYEEYFKVIQDDRYELSLSSPTSLKTGDLLQFHKVLHLESIKHPSKSGNSNFITTDKLGTRAYTFYQLKATNRRLIGVYQNFASLYDMQVTAIANSGSIILKPIYN